MNEKREFTPTELFAMRESIIAMAGESAKTFDKGILTLSAGALAISVTAVHKEFPLGPMTCLAGSWIAFALAILTNLASQLVHMASCSWSLQWVKDTTEKKGTKNKNPFGPWISAINIASIVFFIIGIGLIIGFGAAGIHAQKVIGK